MPHVAYRPPPVTVGQMVLWYDGGRKDPDAKPFSAIVTGVGDQAIALWILGQSTHNGMTRDGVRHVNDPNRRAIDIAEAGAWDHTEDWYLLQRLQDLAAKQELQIQGLQESVQDDQNAIGLIRKQIAELKPK